MADNTSSVETQAVDTETTLQAGTSATTEPQAGEVTTISLDEAKKLRSEAASLRRRLKAYEEAEQTAKDAQLTEQQKLQKELETWRSQAQSAQSKLQASMIDYEVRLQAAQLGIHNPGVAAKLLLADNPTIEFDETTGKPTNIDKLLQNLIRSEPYLAGKVIPSSGGATNPSRSTATQSALSWDVIKKMTPQEYDSRRNEIRAWLRTNPAKF